MTSSPAGINDRAEMDDHAVDHIMKRMVDLVEGDIKNDSPRLASRVSQALG